MLISRGWFIPEEAGDNKEAGVAVLALGEISSSKIGFISLSADFLLDFRFADVESAAAAAGSSLSFFFEDFFDLEQQEHSPVTWQRQLGSCWTLELILFEQLQLTWEFRTLRCSLQCGHWVEGRPLGLIIIRGWSVWVQVVTLWPLMQRSHAYLTPLIRTIVGLK